jgi:hypothetical protein
MADTPIVPHSLDDYFQSTPLGSIDKAIGNNLYGVNHRQTPTFVPSNKDMYGLTFFVRPQLNMQLDNIRNVRQFSPLTTTNVRSIQQFVKCTLDPRLMAGYRFSKDDMTPPIACPMVDRYNAFIPILTNNLNSISGWPDVTAPTYASKSGLYNESHAMVDGITRNYETFDIDASFRNTRGDPILYLFYVWLHYSSFVFEGKLVPYLDMIAENEIDYNTRIYRLVLDKDRNKVTKIAATGASFPISVPTGSFFDFNADKPFNDQNKDITIRFKCMGVDYQDDITIKEFNQTTVIFNPMMSDANRESYMIRVEPALLQMFNNRGYPRINPNTYVLEWWVPKDLFTQRTNAFLNAGLTLGNTTDNRSAREKIASSVYSTNQANKATAADSGNEEEFTGD